MDLRNSSDVPIESVELVHGDGAPVQFGEDLGPGEPFRVLMDQGPLSPGGQVVLHLTAIVPAEVPADGLLESTVLMRASNSNEVSTCAHPSRRALARCRRSTSGS